jgi:hypothetical protein
MMGNLNMTEIGQYLENRRSKGFTVIQVVGNGNLDQMEQVVQIAVPKGVYIGWLPTWGNRGGPYNETTFEQYCYDLATRLKDYLNVIYIMGGDVYVTDEAGRNFWRAGARGCARGTNGGVEKYDNVPITFHPVGPSSTIQWFPVDEPWMMTSMIQSGHGLLPPNDLGDPWGITNTYNTCPKPVLDGEPRYETIYVGLGSGPDRIQPHDSRNAAYWSLFAGSFGHTYGHNDIWQVGGNAWGGTGDFWGSLDAEGAHDMYHVRCLMLSRPFLVRVPDQSVITSAVATDLSHQVATRASDGGYAFVYLAKGGNVTVDMSKISGPVKAWWYDPRNGSTQVIGEYPNSGTREFSAPSSGSGNDWVLVLDDKNRGFPSPGTPIIQTGNPAPQVSFTSPVNGQVLEPAPLDVNMSVDATDSNGSVSKVEFFVDGSKVGEDTNGGDGWSYTWQNVVIGDYTLLAVATDNQGATNSAFVGISVTGPDIYPPTIRSAAAVDATTVSVVYSEAVEEASATNTSSYALDGGVSVLAAAMDGMNAVTLTVSPMTLDTLYTLTVSDVRDRASTPNTIAPGTTVSFLFAETGTILREVWLGIGGGAVSDLTGSAAFAGAPDQTDEPTSFKSPVDVADSYGTRFRGYVHPAATGSYTFWIASDDSSELWLSTDAYPANKVKIAHLDGWTGPENWTANPSQRSSAIALEAGRKYYIEALHKEASGGDHVAVAWEGPGFTREVIPGASLSPWTGASAPGRDDIGLALRRRREGTASDAEVKALIRSYRTGGQGP